MAMRIKIEQPPIQPTLRDPERHDFWTGFVLALIGLIVLVCGARHLTGVETTDGHTAWETQVVKAFSSGGIRLLDLTATPPPPPADDPAARARAEEQFERSLAKAGGPHWKVKVDTGASTPCPT
jgi:hypothetical protein